MTTGIRRVSRSIVSTDNSGKDWSSFIGVKSTTHVRSQLLDVCVRRAIVFLGCSDIDSHIPLSRVRESGDVLRGLGAVVAERIYPRMGHTVNEDEIVAVCILLNK